MKMNRRKKAAASAGFIALAATAVLGGTLAQFTDQDTTQAQTLKAGTVDVTLTEGANWDTSSLLLAIDDTVSRDVTVSNDGNLAVKSIVLSADVVDAAGTEAVAGHGNFSDAVEVTISQDGVALGAPVKLSAIADYNLDLTDALAPGTDSVLTFDYEVVGDDAGTVQGAREDLVANPDNAFQDTNLTVTYTVDAVQRDGIAQ